MITTIILFAQMMGGVGKLMGPGTATGAPGPSEFAIVTEDGNPITTEAPAPEILRVETP
jgi:hypothetical protein